MGQAVTEAETSNHPLVMEAGVKATVADSLYSSVIMVVKELINMKDNAQDTLFATKVA